MALPASHGRDKAAVRSTQEPPVSGPELSERATATTPRFWDLGFGDRKGVRAGPRRGETVHDQLGIGTLPDAARRCQSDCNVSSVPTVGESREGNHREEALAMSL